MRNTKKILTFPQDFLWGAATSAYQVEGGISNNDWAASSRIAPARLACDHYRRFLQDFRIAKGLNHNAHRLSLEWSRLEPFKEQWNDEALDHYFHVLNFLKEHGFTIFLTLHHFTNPLWVAKGGGWLSPKTIEHFVNFTSKICQALGHYIDFWVTINEPNIYALMSYAEGLWPPFEKSLRKTYVVYRNMLAAHNQAYDMIHAYYPNARVGLAQNVAFNEPYRPKNFFDRLATKFADWASIDFALKQTKSDFIGLNHYHRNRIKFRLPQIATSLPQQGELTDKGWEIYPKALYHVLIDLKRFGKPIYITENGIADAKDLKRTNYIISYLTEVHRAVKHKVPVKGYFYWSLLDNYEWPVAPGETGYESKFGLVEVNFKNMSRHIRTSARVYAEICKNNSL